MVSVSPDAPLVRSLRQQILSALRPLLAGVRRCALVGYPNHNNAGDNAIWLGELELLRQLDVEPVYQCDDMSYDRRDLEMVIPGGPILIHGGGNYGDLWPVQQAFREQVMRDFPDRHVLQLPQTVNFTGSASVARHRRVLHERNRPVSILCRNAASVDFVHEQFGLDPILCPDAAFMLVPPQRPKAAVDVLVNQRRDQESTGQHELELAGFSVEYRDWLLADDGHHLRRAMTVRTRTMLRAAAAWTTWDGRIGRAGRRLPMLGARSLAQRRVQRAFLMLGRGRVVVTDRLHGHILSVLLGVPHVVLDTRHGKIRSFHETFTADSDTTVVSQGPDDVGGLVRHLLSKPSGRQHGES